MLCNVRKDSIQRQKGIKRKTESSDVNRNQENGYFLFRFDLETNNFEQFELNIEVDDGLKLSKTYLPMMKCQKNGNILIFYKFLNAASYKPSQLDPFEVYEIIRNEVNPNLCENIFGISTLTCIFDGFFSHLSSRLILLD